MRPFKNPGDLFGAILLSFGLYALSISQGASQSPDSVSIPRASLDRLDRAINDLVDAIRVLKSAPASPPSTAAPPDPPPSAPAPLNMDGRWVTQWQWPTDTILITSGQLEDSRYHGGQLSLEGDGTYELSADRYPRCYYNISMSANRDAMSWTPAATAVPASVCRPATTFYPARDGSEPPREPYPEAQPYHESDCCGPHRDQACCEQPHVQDCCEPHRVRDCCERPHVRECCEPHRVRDCCERPHVQECCEPHRVRDCCERPRIRHCCEPHHVLQRPRMRDWGGERVWRTARVWRPRPPPRDLCERWEPEDWF